MSFGAQREGARASWGLVHAAEVKDFLMLGRPGVGWPLLQKQTRLSAFSMLVRGEEGSRSGICRISGPLGKDEVICTGPANLPFRPKVLDCVLLLLRAGALPASSSSSPRKHLAFIRSIASLVHDDGLVLMLMPGDLSTPLLIAIQEELMPISMAVTSVRAITPESRDQCSPRVLDAYNQIRASNGSTTNFVVIQIQKQPEAIVLTPETCRDYISTLVSRSLRYTLVPEPPYGQSPSDLEFFRPILPESCFLHLPNYYEWEDVYPELRPLLDNFNVVRDEAFAIDGWTPWPEYHFREGGENDWRVYPFLHTFPALDASRSSWIDATCKRCPETVKLLRQIPTLRTALLSKLGPNTRLSAHTGWEDLANHVLRVHLTIKTPSAERVCGVWVEGEVRHHEERDFIVFDDSKIHKAFNLHRKESRIVLILDLLRPKGSPIGVAVGGHTPELDNFIALFR